MPMHHKREQAIAWTVGLWELAKQHGDRVRQLCPERKDMKSQHDAVNHPKHYTSHPSGVECIQVTEHMGFNLGNAVKYIWRADLKADAIEDLKKAKWYIERELMRRELPNA